MSTQEFDNGEPDEFARTDLRYQPAPERSRRAIDRDLLGRLVAQVTVPRAAVAAIVTLILAALVATQLGYTQRLLNEARFRIQMIGVPELSETTIAPQPAAHLTTANWEKILLPAPASQIKDFSADPTDPNSLLVCGISTLDTPTVHGEMTSLGAVSLWLSRDAGKTWAQRITPISSGTYCQISRAPDASQRLTLLIERPLSLDSLCFAYDLLLSDDNGSSWRTSPTTYTPVPVSDAVDSCSYFAFALRGRLYLYTSWRTKAPFGAPGELSSSLAHSDDGGRHWSEMNPDSTQYLNSRTTYLLSGTIITANWPPHQENAEDASILWASTDNGETWKPFSRLRGIVGQRILTALGAQSTLASADHPLYLTYAEHVPSRLLYLKAAEIVDDRHWAYLPPLPVKGVSAEHIGLTSLLGATASGKLLALGVSPTADVTAIRTPDDFPEQWLWSWDPHTLRWTSLAPSLPVAWNACSDGCWQASLAKGAASKQTVLWARGFMDIDGANELYRLTLPAEIA